MPTGTLALYLSLPLSCFFMLQSVPELRGFLDYGATAGLAAYMVWLWNKHTIRWQDEQARMEESHRAATERAVATHTELMERLVDRYDHHLERITLALERNAEASARMSGALDYYRTHD